jgi:class 3 adenylate cyclase/tetratricopeptide (TPR) repeat protein
MAVSTEERRIVTVLFADMAGSTALGEELDPEEMRRLLTRYYAIARESVEQHGGTVEKFIGDAVMAVFGLPTAHGDDPDRAVAAALAMRERIRADVKLNGRFAVRFGVSTGEVVASRDQSAGDFLITGDATNVAARLQQAAEPWAILASDRTVRAAANFEFGDEQEVAAKGKSAPVVARLVVGPRGVKPMRHSRLPFVGRETDLAQLQLAARRAIKEKRPSMVSVIAPAGTGKTRLVEEFLDWLPEISANAVVATAQCLPYGQQLTYWPMRQVLFTLMSHKEDSMPSHLRTELAGWLGRLGVDEADRNARLLAATIGEMGTEGVDRDQLFAAWRLALAAVAHENPLVIVFEDLHWSSDSLLDLAEFVMQPRGESSVLMIVLARPELLDRRPNWGGGRLNHLAIALEPLGEASVADLVRHLLDTDAPDVIKLVSERSEGNPFYAGELVRSYLEHGSLAMLPDTVQATVMARLDLLPQGERRLLQLGTIFGRAFRAAGVAALEGGREEQIRNLCDNLAARDLIRSAEGDRYSFRHILIQEVAYNTLTRFERARLHGAAAQWVEKESKGHEAAVAEILAFHYREAAALGMALQPDSPETSAHKGSAARWLLRAADISAAAAATPEAVRHIRASFDFVDAAMLPQLHERIGDLTGGDSGIEEYRMALEGYAAAGASADDELRALAGMVMVATRWSGAVADRQSLEWMAQLRTRGRGLLERAQDPRSIGKFLAADAFFPFWVQQNRRPTDEERAEADRSAERAIEIGEQLKDPELASLALDAIASTAITAYEWPKALAIARKRISFESDLGLYERLDAHSMVTWMSYHMGDLAAGERDSSEMVSRLLPGQAPYPALHLFAWRAVTLYALGRWDDAVSMFWRAIEAWHDAGSHAAAYGLRGFLTGWDIGRARGDARLVGTATDAVQSIIARFPNTMMNRVVTAILQGDHGFRSEDPFPPPGLNPAEAMERRFNLACDQRQALPPSALEGGIAWAQRIHVPLFEAQVRRARGLAYRDAWELSQAIEIWQRVGAQPQLGRGLAERGMLTGDSVETEAGLAILKKLGDVNYVDRFSTRM